jgi:hypothetical protein
LLKVLISQTLESGESTGGLASSIENVFAGSLTEDAAINASLSVGVADIPINVPAGGPWNYLKVLVQTVDQWVVVAVNEPAVLSAGGTLPDLTWGAGDVLLGPSSEFQPLVPALDSGDVLHLIASAPGTMVRLVFRR